MPRLKAALVVLSLATTSVPAAFAQTMAGAVPGSLQFVQGQANIDGQPLNTKTNSTQPRQLRTGETLATANGSADILLAPGALLRIGQDSTVRMVAEDQTRTEVRLEQGRANVSVNLVGDHSLLLLDMQNGQTQILSRGLYTFNTATNTMRVFNGEADVFPGADTTTDVKPVEVKESHEIVLAGNRTKPQSFDRDTADADLLPWIGPTETRAALADSSMPRVNNAGYGYGSASYGTAGYYPGAYGYAGYYPGAYGFYGDYPYGYGYPYAYGYPWGPYGFWGYPFFGVGFGFWGGGFYGGRGPIGHGYYGGGYGRAAVGGFRGGGSFGGGGFHAGGGGGGRR